MPRIATKSVLANLVDDSDEETTLMSPDHAKENMPPPARAKSRTNQSTVKDPQQKPPPSRRTNAAKAAPNRGRKALKERINAQEEELSEEEIGKLAQADIAAASADELDASMVVEQKKPGRQAKKVTSKIAPKISGREGKEAEVTDYTIAVETPEPQKEGAKMTKKLFPWSKTNTAEYTGEKVIPETQVEAMDVVDKNDDALEVSTVEDLAPPPMKKATNPQRGSSITRQPTIQRRRAGSGSDTERDPALRRKLGDVTREKDKLKLQYENLKEVAVVQAEEKFDKLRKEHEASIKASAAVVNSLKAQLAAQEAQLKEFRMLKKQFAAQSVDTSRMQTELSNLSSSLSEMQIENKTLKTTLAAKRIASSTVECANTRVPGSAVKAGGVRMVGSQEAAEAAEKAALKEDLYGDLTGLIIRNVHRDVEEDVFDCIQTGRNGSKLFSTIKTSTLTISSITF